MRPTLVARIILSVSLLYFVYRETGIFTAISFLLVFSAEEMRTESARRRTGKED